MKYITCDICGREIKASQDHSKLILYSDYGWELQNSERKIDICRDCTDRMIRHMRNKIDEERKNRK